MNLDEWACFCILPREEVRKRRKIHGVLVRGEKSIIYGSVFYFISYKIKLFKNWHPQGEAVTRILRRCRNVSCIQNTSQDSLTLVTLQTLLTSVKYLYSGTWMKLDTWVWLPRARKSSSGKGGKKIKNQGKDLLRSNGKT